MSTSSSQPSFSSGHRRHRFFSRAGISRLVRSRAFLVAILLVLGIAGGYMAGRARLIASGAVESMDGRVKLRPGPWGDVEYLPITIAPPRKLLRVQAIEDEVVPWYFTGMSRNDFVASLNMLGASAKLQESLLSPAMLAVYPEGVRLTPTCPAILEMDDKLRRGLYEILARHPENKGRGWEFRASYLETFPKFGVSRSAASLLEKVSVRNGKYLITYSLPCVLAEIPQQEEKVGMMKALSQQESMLVRLKINPKSDVQALAAYWGRGQWSSDAEAILESLRQRRDGGAINVLELLPPLPGALLHSYPVPHNFLNGPEVVKNCSWTAFNFFRDEPRAEFSNEDFVLKTLKEDYYPVLSDPRYGDIAVFLMPDQTMRHVAVYLADDLFFTKNGDNPWHPWVYSTKEDLIENLFFGLSEGQSLTIHYFRSKAY
jgi:hypothetical protein